MNIPQHLTYTSTHEWLRRDPDDVVIGITDHAQSELTDIVFVELPELGRHLDAGEEIGALESIKTVAYIYAPVAGTVAAVNNALRKQPELINQDPYGQGWIVRLAPDDPEKTVELLEAAAYKVRIEAGD